MAAPTVLQTKRLLPAVFSVLVACFVAVKASTIMATSSTQSTTEPPARSVPMVITTWYFTNATQKAWEVVRSVGASALDAVEKGCTVCEEEQCDGTVGFGGSPDENGETTLDAMIMDGTTHDVGAVGALRRIKSAISVARYVLEYTDHTMLAGELATQFAISMGFPEESLTTNGSKEIWKNWHQSQCQPNFWKNVVPDPKSSCGPYKPVASPKSLTRKRLSAHSSPSPSTIAAPRQDPAATSQPRVGHDTIGMLVIDSNGHIACGTSTNGASHKIPGRVGDSPIAGSGAYCDRDVGGAAGTGDGDVMMRFLPSYQAVESMRRGLTPSAAAEDAIRRIIPYYPKFSGAVIAVSIQGEYGAACHGMTSFPFSVANEKLGEATILTVPCVDFK